MMGFSTGIDPTLSLAEVVVHIHSQLLFQIPVQKFEEHMSQSHVIIPYRLFESPSQLMAFDE